MAMKSACWYCIRPTTLLARKPNRTGIKRRQRSLGVRAVTSLRAIQKPRYATRFHQLARPRGGAGERGTVKRVQRTKKPMG
ncbi:hypothetical protein D3C86_1008370 [compost metagenome]